RVTGIDALPSAAEGEALDQYIPMDLDNAAGKFAAALPGREFERILLLDVLEHLSRPDRLLEEAKSVLSDRGFLIVSLPNIANITVRLALLFGRFTYTERGILDRTHLRFFTRRSARRFLEENGCEVLETRATVMPLELVLGLSPGNPLM